MTLKCAVCRVLLPAPGPAGGPPRRRCAPCRRARRARQAKRGRRQEARRRGREVGALTRGEWAALHFDPVMAARVAREGLVVADEDDDPADDPERDDAPDADPEDEASS